MSLFSKKTATAEPPSKTAAVQRRSRYRVEVKFPVVYRMAGQHGTFRGTALDVSPGGMRVACGSKIETGTVVEIDFTLPAHLFQPLLPKPDPNSEVPVRDAPDYLAPFRRMRIKAVVKSELPAAKGHAYGIEFKVMHPQVVDELHRFTHVVQLARLRERRKMNA
jgi:c-di-GMP-binding flagellar brake protein YcgR